MPDLEKIIRPIVEGQIRGFLKEHPVVLTAVDWYKPRQDKTDTFVNSLAKRIVRDLCCAHSQARMVAALGGIDSAAQSNSSVVLGTADEGGQSGGKPGLAVEPLSGNCGTPAGGVNLERTGLMPMSVHGIVACDGWDLPGPSPGQVSVKFKEGEGNAC